jgi:bifunctional DNA-binding transcriptional regulator/antitoxin component of YhaV-PrlF toxin-antitoxin module
MSALPVEDDVDSDHEAFLDAQGRLTLPDQVIAEAHLMTGDVFDIEIVADGVIRMVRRPDPLDELIGSAPGLSAAADLEALRDEWER